MIAFRKTTTLYPRRTSAVILLSGSLVFVFLGIWMGMVETGIGFLFAAFFGFMMLIAVVQLIPGSAYLQLDTEGFAFSVLFRRASFSWAVVTDFFVVPVANPLMRINKTVGFNFISEYKRADEIHWSAKNVGNCEGALPDTFGMDVHSLAELMNRYLKESKVKNK